MSRFPLISIVLPSYNHFDFVATAVESVLNQKIKDFELIIVDDGSTDGTPEQVEKIKDPRIQLIRLEQNRLHHPRNLALSLARGRYIAFQNSDDEWLPDKLHAQVDILDRQKEIAACFTDVELIDDNNKVLTSSWANGLFTTENRTNIAWLRHFFTRGNCLCISSAMVRSKAIKAVGNFRGSLIQLSDFDLWVRLAAIGDFHIINEKLTRMRIVGGRTADHPKVKAPAHFPQSLFPSLNLHMAARILPAPVKSMIKILISRKSIPVENLDDPKPVFPIVSSGNLSAPKRSSAKRALFEFADVLGNFCKSPILDLTPRIFEDAMPVLKDSMYIRQAWLAQYAWSFNSASHSIFADRIMAAIMENEMARSEVTNVFGAEIVREFVRRRGQFSFKIEKNE